jgi:hypothetical protein
MAGASSSQISSEIPIFSWGYMAYIGKIEPFAVASVGLPKCGNKVVEVHLKNSIVTVAGKEEHQQIEVQVRHFVSLKVAASLFAWHQKIISGGVLRATGYKEDIRIELIGAGGGGGGAVIGKGCWPSMIAFGEASYDRSEIMLGSLTLEVDTVQV